MANNPNEPPYSLFTVIFGNVDTPCKLRQFDAMYAALPDDVKASADVIPYPGPYDFCFTLKITPHAVASWAVLEAFPRLLDALALLPAAPCSDLLEIAQAWRHKLTEMAQEWRKAKAANTIPSQPAQDVPAVAGTPKAIEDIEEQRIIELYSNPAIRIDAVAEGALISRAKLYRRLPALVKQGKLKYRESHKSLTRVPRDKK